MLLDISVAQVRFTKIKLKQDLTSDTLIKIKVKFYFN